MRRPRPRVSFRLDPPEKKPEVWLGLLSRVPLTPRPGEAGPPGQRVLFTVGFLFVRFVAFVVEALMPQARTKQSYCIRP